jgi:hypothetical protein
VLVVKCGQENHHWKVEEELYFFVNRPAALFVFVFIIFLDRK